MRSAGRPSGQPAVPEPAIRPPPTALSPGYPDNPHSQPFATSTQASFGDGAAGAPLALARCRKVGCGPPRITPEQPPEARIQSRSGRARHRRCTAEYRQANRSSKKTKSEKAAYFLPSRGYLLFWFGNFFFVRTFYSPSQTPSGRDNYFTYTCSCALNYCNFEDTP